MTAKGREGKLQGRPEPLDHDGASSSSEQGKAVTVSCPAKLNLYLRVLAREASGYHQIESVFQGIGLYDQLDLELADTGTLELEIDAGTDASVDPRSHAPIDPKANTVVHALRLLLERTGSSHGVRARLKKGIPAGTGLGGGSSDAAGALLGLNRLLGQPLSNPALVELGGQVGADVPFFCVGAPTAIVWGRGGRVLPQDSPEAADVVVCVPKVRVSTAAAYQALSKTLDLPRPAASLGREPTESWGTLKALQHNDFEQVAFREHKVLESLRAALEQAGATVARMTGSGSAVFGVFQEPAEARAAQAELARREEVTAVLSAKTLTTGPLNRVEARR